jgi:hypothetical protein
MGRSILLLCQQQQQMTATPTNVCFFALLGVIAAIIIVRRKKSQRTIVKGPTIKRTRRSIHQIFYELGTDKCHRWLRMKANTFWKLHNILDGFLKQTEEGILKRKRGAPSNGEIQFATRLAVAIRYFCGACPVDLCIVFGIDRGFR